jgi:hypothetical protein
MINILTALVWSVFVLRKNGSPNYQFEFDAEAVKKRASSYRKKAKVLRQINSNKMGSCRRWKKFYDLSIFVPTLILTFFSFYGLEKVHENFVSKLISQQVLNLSYNILILFVLVLSALQMASRLGEQEVEHFGTVKKLTDFITDLDDIIELTSIPKEMCSKIIGDLNTAYENITGSLPQNSDKEWEVAKKQLEKKSRVK